PVLDGKTWETDIYGQYKFESAVPKNPEMESTDLVVAYRDDTRYSKEWFSADGATDDLSVVITIRNDTINKKIGTNITYQPLGDGMYETCRDEYEDALVNDVLNGTHKYDIVAAYAYAAALPTLRDSIANLADKSIFPYFDFSLPCWNKSIIKNAKVNGKLYYVTGDLNLSTFDASIVTFVNKTLYNEKKEVSDPADIQDVALDGKWDYEEMYKWSTRTWDVDVNGTNDCSDVHGISAAYHSIPLDAFPYAWDLEFVKTTGNTHAYSIVGNAKITDAFTKISNLLNASVNEGVTNSDNASNCPLSDARSEPIIHFVNDRAVFVMHKLYATPEDHQAMITMSSEFGLMPMPKYDKSQANYGTTAHDSYTLMIVPNHTKSDKPTYGKTISAWLQLNTEVSYTSIRGYYINRIVKPGYFGVNDVSGTVTKSIKLFNNIADNIEFSFLYVYAPQLCGVVTTCWRDAVMAGYSAEAVYTSNQAAFDADLATLDQWLAS
ncbi:MAG: hypothetical protein J6U68_04765, partial [Clostridia bacterium]|nr:hypothetical protein [Clostridia bacterium]